MRTSNFKGNIVNRILSSLLAFAIVCGMGSFGGVTANAAEGLKTSTMVVDYGYGYRFECSNYIGETGVTTLPGLRIDGSLSVFLLNNDNDDLFAKLHYNEYIDGKKVSHVSAPYGKRSIIGQADSASVTMEDRTNISLYMGNGINGYYMDIFFGGEQGSIQEAKFNVEYLVLTPGKADEYLKTGKIKDSFPTIDDNGNMISVITEVEIPGLRELILSARGKIVPSTWAKDFVDKANANGLIPTYLDNSYQSNIKRGEFCDLVVKLIEVKKGKSIDKVVAGLGLQKGSFNDTTNNNTLYANALGIVNGIGNGLFDPNGEITREQAAVMLANTAKVLGYDITKSPNNTFPDKASIASWASPQVNFLFEKGIMSGTGTGFEPKGKYTREQAFITIVRMFDMK